MNNYKFKANIKWLGKKRDSLLKKLTGSRAFVDGSVVTVRRRCGYPGCECEQGKKHESLYLMYKVKGKTKGIYIPVELRSEVRAWSKEWQAIKKTIQEICHIQKSIIKRHVRERRLKKGRK